ncbi:hypothetical protein SADUNF_Sadunf06G0193300 [Salix dunnii]|uniref:Uncharacterized protein n=1 Tax=Salix dunnii TaxID=1413687 RepID=A0A835N397_9ROSI|nr:hypothetical protein SADUNF_Sadunf06G0193300 [Salix dunnii]
MEAPNKLPIAKEGQNNHSISDDFLSKWQSAPKQGVREMLVQTEICLFEIITTLSILLQVLSSIYSTALPFLLFYAWLRIGRAEEKSP